MLGIGLMLFCLRTMAAEHQWKTKLLNVCFWLINVGLVLMVVLSLLPIGIAQVIASIDVGMWYARSAEFMQQDYLQTLRWLRMIGDTVFAAGLVGLAWFVIGLKGGWSIQRTVVVEPERLERLIGREQQEQVLN